MPHSERGFAESLMGITRNMILSGYRMVNLLKPRRSLHAPLRQKLGSDPQYLPLHKQKGGYTHTHTGST